MNALTDSLKLAALAPGRFLVCEITAAFGSVFLEVGGSFREWRALVRYDLLVKALVSVVVAVFF